MMADSFATWQQVYLRILLAGLLALLVFHRQVPLSFWREISARAWLVFILRGIMAYVVGVGFVTIAIQHSQLGVVSFISSLPIMGILGWLLFRERVTLLSGLLVGLSVVGLWLLTGLEWGNIHLGWGETAALISLIGFDLGYLLSRYHPKQNTNAQNTTVLLLVGCVPALAISLALHESIIPTHVTPVAWIGLFASSVLNVIGLFVINYVFQHLKAYVAGNLFLLEGVIALVVGYVLYREVPPLTAVFGAIIILICAYGVSYFDQKRDRLVASESELLANN